MGDMNKKKRWLDILFHFPEFPTVYETVKMNKKQKRSFRTAEK